MKQNIYFSNKYLMLETHFKDNDLKYWTLSFDYKGLNQINYYQLTTTINNKTLEYC